MRDINYTTISAMIWHSVATTNPRERIIIVSGDTSISNFNKYTTININVAEYINSDNGPKIIW